MFEWNLAPLLRLTRNFWSQELLGWSQFRACNLVLQCIWISYYSWKLQVAQRPPFSCAMLSLLLQSKGSSTSAPTAVHDRLAFPFPFPAAVSVPPRETGRRALLFFFISGWQSEPSSSLVCEGSLNSKWLPREVDVLCGCGPLTMALCVPGSGNERGEWAGADRRQLSVWREWDRQWRHNWWQGVQGATGECAAGVYLPDGHHCCLELDAESARGRVLFGLFRSFLFRNRNNRIHRISVPNKTDRALFWKQNSWRDQKRPARTRNFPAKILFRPFCYREQNERNSILFIPE